MRCVALLLLLAGCSHPILTPVEVSVPVGIPCRVEEPQAPAWPTMALTADAGLFEKAKAALAELELRRGYEGELLAATRACR